MNYDFRFTEAENADLRRILLDLSNHPYVAYADFMQEIRDVAGSGGVPSRFVEYTREAMGRDMASHPLAVMGNCPIDQDLAPFDPADPVTSKYDLKTTFVTEGFLALHAVLAGTEIIAHRTVNDGDFFHDIYPKESMYESQSQKTLKTLKFHRDFTNHFVSPDFVTTITIRDTPENEVYSTFAVNRRVIADLEPSDLALLREELFHTPFDDVSTRGAKLDLGRARDHAVISSSGVKVFEGRTVGLTQDAQQALEHFVASLHRNKQLHVGRPGDAISFSNSHVIHGREVRELRDLASLKQRWLMKTHTVYSLTEFQPFFEQHNYGVVNG